MQTSVLSSFKRWRWYKHTLWAVALFFAYLVFGFFLLPPLIKWQMVKRLPELTRRQTSIRQVRCNPLALSLTIRGLALTEADGRPFASWEEFYVNFQASSLFRWAWTFKEIRLVKPFGEIILFKDGRLNFANMFPPATNAPPPVTAQKASIPRVNIFHLLITNGFVSLEDQTRRSPFRTEYRPINLELTHFTTRPNSDTPYSFRAESDAGRSVSWAGDFTVQPLRSRGRLEVTGVQLSRYQPYVEDFTKALLTNGLADLRLNYRFEAGTNGIDLTVTNGTVHVERMALQDPATGENVAGFRGFDVAGGEFHLLQRVARLGTVKVSEATLLARLSKEGRLNLLELLTLPGASTNAVPAETNAPATGALPPWTVYVDDVAIQNTAVSFEDLTHRAPFRTEFKPLAVTLKHFSSKADTDAEYSFHIATEADETFEGAGTLSINPIRSAGEIKLTSMEVKKYLPYAEDFFQGQITAGKLSLTAPYQAALVTNQLRAGVTNFALQLSELEIKPPGADETIAHVASFELGRVDASLEERHARVGLLSATGGSLLARRERDGSINFLGLLAPGKTNAAPAETNASAGPAQPWTVSVDEVALKDYSVRVEDRQLPKPGVLLLDHFELDLKGLSTASNAPVNIMVSGRLNETGTFGVQGQAKAFPPSADMVVGLTNLELRPFQPWLDSSVQAGIVSGALGVQGRLRYNSDAEPRMAFNGDVSLTNFLCTDEVAFKELARWELLTVSGIDCTFQPTRLKVAEVDWVAPKTTVLISSNRQMNLATILKSGPPAGTNAAPPAAGQGSVSGGSGAGGVPVEVALVKLERASLAFVDESLQPHASLGVQELSGTIKGLSSAMNTTADVDLTGKVDELSPFGVAGKINPLTTNLFVDLVISNANTQLTPLTPYLEKYAGHPLNKGRLTTVLRYHVENNELKAENKIDIEHLTLGPRNNSPDATSLPVKLAVALLKDSEGRIELNLPVHGRLDDPQFSLGPIVFKVLANIIVKAAASPFKLLGALVGGGEELSFVSFVPGTTNLVEGETEKLTKLAKALAQRPALNLEIEGAVDPVSDRDALARQKLREQFTSARLKTLSAKGKAPQAMDSYQLPPEDYDQLLRAAFAERFGTNIAAILRTNQMSLASTNHPPAKPAQKPKQSLYRRALALVGFGPHVHKSASEKHLPKADRLALRQMTPELMEKLVARQIEISNDDYGALMTSRSRWIQNWLLQNGQVAGERLLLVAPKPIDDNYQGGSQANLSLD